MALIGDTKKRFQRVFIKDNELEFQDNGIVNRFNNYRLEEFLNELHKENEQLKNIIVFAYTLMSMNTISDEDYFEFYELCENMGVSLNDWKMDY